MEHPEVNHANETAALYFHLFITFDPIHIQSPVLRVDLQRNPEKQLEAVDSSQKAFSYS